MVLAATLWVFMADTKLLQEITQDKDAVLFTNAQATVGAYLKSQETLWFCKEGNCEPIQQAFGPGHIGFQSGPHFVTYKYRDPKSGLPEIVREMHVWRQDRLLHTVRADFPHLPASVAYFDDGLVVFSLEEDRLLIKKYSAKGLLLGENKVNAPVHHHRYTRGRLVSWAGASGLFLWIPQSGYLLEMNGDLEIQNMIEMVFPERLVSVDNHLFSQFIEHMDQKGVEARTRFLEQHKDKVFRYEPMNLLAGDKGTWQIIYQVLIVEPEREEMQFMSINSLVVEYRNGAIVGEKLMRHKNVLGFFEKALAYQEEDRTIAFE